MKSIRLNRYLASSGLASRRTAEEYIIAGRVSVNGEVAILTTKVMPEDKVTLDGQLLTPEKEKVYFLLNKPRGYVCSTMGEPKILDLFKEVPYRLFTVGRLDKDTEGLLLVTNDGSFSDHVIHPSRNLQKEYIAKADQEITDEHLKSIANGTLVEGIMVKPIRVEKVRKGTIKIVIGEGKKREVRILLESVGLQTLHLKRIRVGSLVLGDLPTGSYRPLEPREIERLLEGTNDDSLEVPEALLEFPELTDEERLALDRPEPQDEGERKPFRERSFGRRNDEEREFAGQGRPSRERPPFRKEGEESRSFGGERRPYRAPSREGQFERRERPHGERDSQPREWQPRSNARGPRDFGDRQPRPFFSSRQRDSESSGRAPRTDRREGGFSGSREGGFSGRREGGFSGGRRGGGFAPRREGGFGGRREGGFSGERREGGFPPRREGSFGPRKEGGFGGRREGGFAPRREGGFGGRREGGFSGERRERSFGSRREGGFAPRFAKEGEGRAPREWQGERKFPRNNDRPPFQRRPFLPKEDA